MNPTPPNDLPPDTNLQSGPPGGAISLASYYADPKASAGRLLSAWNKGTATLPSDSERHSVLETLQATDPDLKKSLQLATNGFMARRAAIANMLVSWVQQVIVSQFDAQGWMFPNQEQGASAVYQAVLVRLRLGLDESRKARKRYSRVALLTLLWLHHSRQLRVTEAASEMHAVFGSSIDNQSDLRRVERAAAVFLGTKANELTSVLDFSSLWESRLRSEGARAANIEKILHDAESKIALLEREQASLHDEVNQLRSQNEKLSGECEDLRRRELERQEGGDHRVLELRSRSTAFLNRLADGQLTIAMEAAKLIPPRPTVVIEKLELGISAIKKEVQWLQSSD